MTEFNRRKYLETRIFWLEEERFKLISSHREKETRVKQIDKEVKRLKEEIEKL